LNPYVCSSCGRPHAPEEFKQNRFCRNCGKFLSRRNKSSTKTDGNERGKTASDMKIDFMRFFPYEPYPQQLEFLKDIERVLSGRGVLVAEACNGFGKTICALSSVLPLGRKTIYATRTHEQVRQVLREVEQINKKSGADFSAAALASRQNLCLNDACRRLSSIEATAVCKALRKKGRCPYRYEFDETMSSLPLILPAARLVRLGKRGRLCPYFLARKAAETRSVVVAPYQYIFNEKIRAHVNLEIGGKILVFDEAHNADKIGQEALSDTLSERALNNAKRELQLVGVPSAFIDDLSDHLEKNVSPKPAVKSGAEFLQDLRQILGEDLSFFADAFTPIVEEIRDYKIEHEQVPLCYLNGVINFLSMVGSSENESYVAIYRRSRQGLNLIEYHCLDPSLAIKPVIEQAYAALIMSGTLSPIKLFTETLCLHGAETRAYSAIAQRENVRTFLDTSVTTKFKERNPEMTRLYGERISRLMKKVPNGALIFFPQRKMMIEALEIWRKNGYIKEKDGNFFLNEKRVFIEGEHASENAEIVDKYKKTARRSEGAVLFAVFRGRNAEGSNFPYEEARGIFLVGLPYADYHDPLVRAQIQYFNKKTPRLGELWYLMDAFRAANQAIGRGIRHRDDWCHFYLMDRRYGSHWRFISKWAIENGIEEISQD